MKLSCAIIDDEPLAVGLLESYVRKTPVLEWKGSYYSAMQAADALREHPVQLLFLDIQMPELNGLEFSRMITEPTRVIFTTAFDRYALEGFRVNALDYLLKPVSYTDFLAAVNKAVRWFELSAGSRMHADAPVADVADDFICVKSDYKLYHISLSDILYIEGLKDYVKIYLEGQERPVVSLVSMKSMEEKLPASRFMRVHRSYIVQKNKIKVIDRLRIVFGKTYIPVSESYKQALTDYLENRRV